MWKIVKDARDAKEPAAIVASFHMPEMVQHKKIVPFQTKGQNTPLERTHLGNPPSQLWEESCYNLFVKV